jgi:hypothetical protein
MDTSVLDPLWDRHKGGRCMQFDLVDLAQYQWSNVIIPDGECLPRLLVSGLTGRSRRRYYF